MSRSYESPTRKAQAEATRLRILRALIDLLVEEGPATVSIPQVARRADVSVRIVYHYFPTKEALFESLTETMPALVDTTGGAPPSPRSPAELSAAMRDIYRFLDANARMFRAVNLSELGAHVASSRQAERHERMDAALAPLADRLDADDLRRLRAVVGLIASFDAYGALTGVWGLERDEAADVAAWAVRVLCDRARRSGVGD